MGTILVVQADPALAASWTDALTAAGHSTLAEKDIANAMVRAREGGIDAVVLDSMEPGRNARALTDELERLPEPPPLILVSSSPKAPELSAHLGAAAFIPKPCSPAELAAVVQSVVSARVRLLVDDEITDRVSVDDL